jgi:hypothetical protein
MIESSWISILLDYNRASEFTGDDVDRYSALCDLGRAYEKILLYIPDLVASTVSVYVQRDGAIATVPKPLHYRQSSDNATAAWATTNSSELCYIIIPAEGVQYFRLYTSADQTSDVTFYAKGIRS